VALSPRPAVSVVLPAYNEEANLERTVRELLPVLEQTAADYEILIVDDGSRDETAAIAARLAAEVPRLRVLRHDRNRGYGAALRTGFAAARREWILLLDADGQFRPGELPRFIAAAGRADLIIGSREQRADPPHRRLFAAVWRLLTGVLLGVRARDTNCGFKLMRAAVIQALDLQAGGALISAELLAKARRSGAVIVELPVTHAPRRYGRQTGGSVRVMLRAYYELARLAWRIRRFGGRLSP
jgi:glycosyltransferase involved in cell wall biosynthesis